MIKSKSSVLVWGLLAAVALVQTAALAKIVTGRQALLTSGREIVMKVTPVDPRDLFRGDYVILGYGLSPLNSSTLKDASGLDDIAKGSVAYVTITEEAGHIWKPVRVTPSYPAQLAAGEAVLKGLVTHRWTESGPGGASTLNLQYGIENYFVPEGTGKRLEQMVRDQTVEAVIAVGTQGEAAIKGLIIAGERHVDPPLY
jgi:uncharacterized membrane-anchored protein